jgi:MFS family permease
MISTAALAALLLRRTGHRWPMVIGYVIVIVGMLGLAYGPAVGVSPYLWLAAAAAVSGVGMGTATPASNNASMSLAPDQAAAIAGLRACSGRPAGSPRSRSPRRSWPAPPTPDWRRPGVFVVFAGILAAALPLIRRVPDQHGRW